MWSHCGHDYHYAGKDSPIWKVTTVAEALGSCEAAEQALVKQGALADPRELIKTYTASTGRKHLLIIKLHPIYVGDGLDF